MPQELMAQPQRFVKNSGLRKKSVLLRCIPIALIRRDSDLIENMLR
jgi:hypothetical protein